MKHLESLRTKFEKDDQFFKEYKNFMEELMEKGYSRKCDGKGLDDRTWYVPPPDVLNHNKGKIRVVFDCSSRYRGISINENLLSGSDLTNQLVEILIRFWVGPVAFMADIQSMFYQVKVPVKQRSFLRFLWWNEGNLDSEITNHEMSVHLFGAVSSPSSSNYALRKAALNNSSWYGNDAVAEIMKNFYVDDLLKSVENEEYAKDLIKRIQKMCSAGGFNLKKFISNYKLVLMSIPENHRRKGVKDADLVNEELPTESAIGVHWNVEKDQLCFKLNLKAGNITRRGMLSTLSSFYDSLGLASPFILRDRKILQDLCQEGLQWDETVSEMYQKK